MVLFLRINLGPMLPSWFQAFCSININDSSSLFWLCPMYCPSAKAICVGGSREREDGAGHAFLRFLGLGSRKIGVFLWGFLGLRMMKFMFLRALFHSCSSVFQGVVGFGRPAVDKICLLKLSLLIGIMELCVRP